jgi:hypothetical protein
MPIAGVSGGMLRKASERSVARRGEVCVLGLKTDDVLLGASEEARRIESGRWGARAK